MPYHSSHAACPNGLCPPIAMGFGIPDIGFGMPAMGFGIPAMGFCMPAMGLGMPAMGLGMADNGFCDPANGLGNWGGGMVGMTSCARGAAVGGSVGGGGGPEHPAQGNMTARSQFLKAYATKSNHARLSHLLKQRDDAS